MSIRKMIALHPDAREHVNQPLGDAVHHLMYCAKMCASCADACLAEPMDMTQCIRVCLDCADVCEATGRLALRRSGDNAQVVREMLELCARTCDACAAECEKHEHEHCETHEEDLDGLLAVCLQHEMDHLEGVLFIDHLSKLKRDMVLKKLAKARKERALRAA